MNFFSNSLKTAAVFSLCTTELDSLKNVAHNSFFKQKIKSRDAIFNKPNSQINLTPGEFVTDAIEVVSPFIIVSAASPIIPYLWGYVDFLVNKDRIDHTQELNQEFSDQNLTSTKKDVFWNRSLLLFSILSTYELLRGATHVAIDAVEQLAHGLYP